MLLLREVLQASYSEQEEPENLLVHMEFDSLALSGECAAILENPLRMPMLTFRMYMGRAHSRLLASLTRPLSVRSCSHSGEPLDGSEDISRIQTWLPSRN